MMFRSSFSRRSARYSQSRRAFSLVEMLVALAILMVLLAVTFIPIKLAGDMSGIATARAGSQQSAVDGIARMKSDIKHAILILPNAQISGVTDQAPYATNIQTVPGNPNPVDVGNGGFPYLRDATGYKPPTTATSSDGDNQFDACGAGVTPAPNTARLDLILPNEDEGTVDASGRASNVLVSYYARRRDIQKAFHPVENPVVLYRAQIPFRVSFQNPATGLYQTTPFKAWGNPTAFNANLSNSRFSTKATSCGAANKADIARGLQWLTMNQYGEFDLAPLCSPKPGTAATTGIDPNAPPTFGSHTLVLPRDTALLTPYGETDSGATPSISSLVPDVTFSLGSDRTDRKINIVKIQLSVGQYDANSINRRDLNNPPPAPPVPPAPPAPAQPRSALQPQVARTITEVVVNRDNIK